MRIVLSMTLAVVSAVSAPLYKAELIFPLESWHNHSSSVVELPNGDLLVCWFHGSGERTADDVKIEGARWNKQTGKWSERFTMADTPGFPDTNPTMFIDSRQRLLFFWPVIIAHQWETALMKYRISTDYNQASAPPKWEHQDNIILIPKDIAAKTREVFEKDKGKEGRTGSYAAKVIEHADDMYFSPDGLVHPYPSHSITFRAHLGSYVFGRLFFWHHGHQR
jgi:hypothetical protein